MPHRYIVVPSPIQFKDPRTGAPWQEKVYDEERERLIDKVAPPLTFEDFFYKLMLNPIWDQGPANGRAAQALWDALDNARTTHVMDCAEEDWKLLDGAVKSPQRGQQTPFGMQPVPGFGFLAVLSPQLKPFTDAIRDAKTEPPKAEPAPEAAEAAPESASQ